MSQFVPYLTILEYNENLYLSNGNLCWVTTLDEVGQVQLWDPLNGTFYRPNDPRCPLTAVYCAADQSNVYYNVQSKFRIPV